MFKEEKLVCFKDFCRYHMDYLRGSKSVCVLYLPSEVVEQIRSAKDLHIPHINNVAKMFEKAGLGAKYLQKWFRQMCNKLRIDSEVIRVSAG